MTDSELFNADQQREYCLMIAMGCDRETACKYLGITAMALRDVLHHDPSFERQLMRAEAASEFHHMRNIHSATRDEKHWRASVWWLERQSPERYGRRPPEAISGRQLQQLVEAVCEVILTEASGDDEKLRLLNRLQQIVEQVQVGSFHDATEQVTQNAFADRASFEGESQPL